MTVMLCLRTLKDMTEKLEAYKRPNDTPLTTITRLVDHHERTSKFLPSVNLDSQIINIHKLFNPSLEALNTLFFL